MRTPVFLLLLLVSGCKAPVAAPAELDELMGFLFEHLADEDPAALSAGAVNLDVWLVDRIEETEEGYTVDVLSNAAISGLGEGERDNAGLDGAAVGHVSVHAADALTDAAVTTDPSEIYGTYEAYERADREGDPDCFMSLACDLYTFEVWQTASYAGLITVEAHSMVQYRWVDTDIGRVMLQRTWLREPAVVTPEGFIEVEQQYYMWGLIPMADGGARAIRSVWVVAELITDGLDEDIALNMLIDSMAKDMDTLDAYVAEQ